MSFRYLLDTNVLSEPAKLVPNENVLHKLEVCQSEVATASIVIHELVYGCWRSLPSRSNLAKFGLAKREQDNYNHRD